MKPEDQAAFEDEFLKYADWAKPEFKSYENGWIDALEYRDAQPAVAVNEPWYSLLCNLVEGLNRTHWSSRQTTAHFQQQLSEAKAAIAAAEAAKGGV